MEHPRDSNWTGTSALWASPDLDRRRAQEDMAWAVHLAAEETEADMRRRWLRFHLEAQDNKCLYCGVLTETLPKISCPELQATVDHIIPRSKEGPDVIGNTSAACRRCNMAKGSMSLDEFLTSQALCENIVLAHPCPDRLSVDSRSPLYKSDLLDRGVRIWVDDVEFKNVHSYDRVEGWVFLFIKKTKDRNGNRMTLKKRGRVQAIFDDVCEARERVLSGELARDVKGWLAQRMIPETIQVQPACVAPERDISEK